MNGVIITNPEASEVICKGFTFPYDQSVNNDSWCFYFTFIKALTLRVT